MNDKLIWLVRLIGIIVFLVLVFLLMSLHARLVKMNQEAGSAPATVSALQGKWGSRVLARTDVSRPSPTSAASSQGMMRGTFRCPDSW